MQSLQRYNPELQRRSLEKRKEKQEDFDNFVGRLKEYSKSNKPGQSSKSLGSDPPVLLMLNFGSLDGLGARSSQAARARHPERTRSQEARCSRGRSTQAGAEEFATLIVTRAPMLSC